MQRNRIGFRRPVTSVRHGQVWVYRDLRLRRKNLAIIAVAVLGLAIAAAGTTIALAATTAVR